jgi:RHS repeat-associated protein
MLAASTFTYLHDDKLGRPQAATDASQTVVWKASYLPFGETIATSGSFTQNLRFPGQYADAESGFSHNGFRDYVPSLGRYLEADPLGIYDNTGRLNAGMNPFLYVGADPMRSIDPWGLYWSNGTSCYTHQGQGGTIVPGFLCAIDRLITTLQNLESYTADTCGGAGGPMPGTQCSNYGLAPAAPALLELAALDTGLKTAIGEGGVPLAVVEENTIVLGLRNFDLQSTADQIGGSTLMTNGDWQVALQTALSNPNTNIVVSLDGVSGASTYSQFMSAAQQGIAAGPSASPFNWEMGQIYQAGRQGSVTFMRSGKVVPNPFQ